MRRSALLLGVLALAGPVASPAVAAGGGGGGCPAYGPEVIFGAAGIVDHALSDGAEGAPLEGRRLKSRGHFYEATADAQLDVLGNRARITKGTIFKFGCYSASRTSPRYPAVVLLRGRVAASTVGSEPLGVVTNEGLMDPRQDKTMNYRIDRRTKKANLDLADKLMWVGNIFGQPIGTTTVRSTSGAIVGVTPYVGEGPGRCRYVHRARLTSTGGKGSSRFD